MEAVTHIKRSPLFWWQRASSVSRAVELEAIKKRRRDFISSTDGKPYYEKNTPVHSRKEINPELAAFARFTRFFP